MVDPSTNSLLLLYDDAQSIYERERTKQFSFKSVGIQAQGRTTILKINYRNTQQILQTASLIAADLLTADDSDDDGMPLLQPISCGREGHAPLIIRLPSLRDEATQDRRPAERRAPGRPRLGRHGHLVPASPRDRTVRRRAAAAAAAASGAQKRRRLRPDSRHHQDDDHARQQGPGVSGGGASRCGSHAGPKQEESEEARLFYVAATRATHALYITLSGDGEFGRRLPNVPPTSAAAVDGRGMRGP